MTDSSSSTDPSRAAAYWNESHAERAGGSHDNFQNHPLIQAYVSLRAFGSLVGHLDVVVAELRTRTAPGDRILSVGCGAAVKERALARALPDRHFIGMDIAEDALESTRQSLAEEGISNVSLEYGDFNRLDLENGRFRAILGLGAIHHVEALEAFWEGCHHGLRPDGALLAQEYVGPNRFQWTDAQLEHCNRVLEELVPEAHKTHHRQVVRIPLDTIIRIDPSEAVRSAEIIETCEASPLRIEGRTGAGCALLQPVLMDQIRTFDPTNWEHNHVLSRLFVEEDRLMSAGVLGDDFAMFVARPS